MKRNWHKDPYLYDDVPVLKNIPGVKTSEELKRIEGDLTQMTMGIVYAQEYPKFNTDTLCQIHRTIFGGIYQWAGEFRTINIMKREDVLGGDTVQYAQPEDIKNQLDMVSKEISKLKHSEDPKTLLFKIVRITAAIWQTHPFREGNARAVIAFSVLLAAKMGIELDYDLFAEHAAYVRNALVWCTQGMYSQYEYIVLGSEAAELGVRGGVVDPVPAAGTLAAVYGHIGALGNGADELALSGSAGADVQAAVCILDLAHSHVGSCVEVA